MRKQYMFVGINAKGAGNHYTDLREFGILRHVQESALKIQKTLSALAERGIKLEVYLTKPVRISNRVVVHERDRLLFIVDEQGNIRGIRHKVS